MDNLSREKLEEAITIFGHFIVDQVNEVVNMSDTDGAWSLFNERGMFEHAECLEFLFFD